jgi:hypothetical protein
MKPTECPHCHSAELAHGRMTQRDYLFFMSFFRGVYVQAAACLECGTVISYLDSKALEQVCEWHAQARPEGKQATTINDDL